MKKKDKQEKHDLSKEKKKADAPDHRIKPAADKGADEKPEIYKIVKKGDKPDQGRRDVLKKLGGTLSLASLAGAISNCDNSKFSVNADNEKCTCHVVCTCDVEKDKKKSSRSAQYSGTVCTCNLICTCNTVSTCSCDSDSGNSCSSCSSTYWYPC